MQPPDSIDSPIQPRPIGCAVPLTALQLRTWNRLIKQGTLLSDMRMAAVSVRVVGPLNAEYLRRSIEAVMQRHESLRTRIAPVGGIPRQHIDINCECQIEIIDLTGVPPQDIEQEARALAQEFVDKKIDLSVGPLFEARLLRLSSQDHVLVVGLNHIVSDGTSNMILGKEIWTLYKQAVRGLPFSLPPLPVQFADYAVWQQRTYSSWLQKHKSYWKERLAGAPRATLPQDDGIADVRQPTRAMMQFPFGKSLSGKLHELARRERVPLSSVVLAIYVASISRWSNQRDLVFAFVSHGRYRRPELANMIGILPNLLHLRIKIGTEDDSLDLLRRVNLELGAAYCHQDYNRVPDFAAEGTMELFFNWVPSTWLRSDEARWHVHETKEADGQLELQPFPIQSSPVQVEPSFKLMVAPSDTASGIVITVWYRSDLLSLGTVQRFLDNLSLLAADFAQRPSVSIASLSFAS